MGKLCFLTVAAVLVCSWAALDSWNRDTSMELSVISEVKKESVDPNTGAMIPAKEPYDFPLSLAFFQFAFMGLFFGTIWLVSSTSQADDIAKVYENVFSARWSGMVATHVFSTFWLQALMMPREMMTPVTFAASRALEVPAAAGLRSQVMGHRYGGHPMLTIGLMTGASMLLTFSQMQIAGCFCIWSGNGVQLAGVAMFLIYALVLIFPAANAVCLESVMVKLDTNPILMLAMMNVLACLCFLPILALAHFTGWENVVSAFTWTASFPQLYMLVLWLCVQMTAFSVINLALIGMLDSFWAVALHSFKAIYWWCDQFVKMLLFSEVALSIQSPDASFWAFIMLCGVILVGVAAVIDAKAHGQLEGLIEGKTAATRSIDRSVETETAATKV